MATSASYVGDGATRTYNIPFTYEDPVTIHAKVDGQEVSFTWVSPSQVELTAIPAAGATVTLYRRTDIGSAAVEFANAQILTAEELNDANSQLLCRQQELENEIDKAEDVHDALDARAGAIEARLTTDEARLDAVEAIAAKNGAGTGIPLTQPRRLTYGYRLPVRTYRKAVDLANTIHTTIRGFAAGATGGLGKTRYLVQNASTDPTIPDSWGAALAAARANGGGIIQFDTRQKFDIIVTADVRINFNNVTIIAPGRNVTFWTKSIETGFIYESVNCITAFIEFRTLAGPMTGDLGGEAIKSEKKLVSVDPVDCDMIAFVGCEFRHASDGACDWSSSLFTATSTQVRGTVQDCIFWDTDQAMLVGSNDATCTDADPVLMQLTLDNVIFAYCGERQPKVLGRTFVDMVDCYTLTMPWQRDNLAPVNEFSINYGVGATYGGKVRSRGCLWTSATGDPYDVFENITTGVTHGFFAPENCVAEGSVIAEANATSVPAPAYVRPHTPIPAAGALRDQWIADRWRAAGARVDAAPDGEFVWSSDTSIYPNGETVLVDRQLGGRWVRVDRVSYGSLALASAGTSSSVLEAKRGDNITIAAGAITIDPDNSYMTIGTEGGITTDDLSTINGGVDGRIIILRASSSTMTITLKPGGNIDILADVVFTRQKTVSLLWDTALLRWMVLSARL